MKFNRNYNRKLNCNYFTTIRPKVKHYEVGDVLDILLLDAKSNEYRTKCKAEVVEVEYYKYLEYIPKLIFRLDTGLDKLALRLLYSFYIDLSHDTPWQVITLRRIINE